MDVNGLNMFEQPYGQYTVVHPMVNPPACDAPSDDVHWYTKTLGVLTTPQCQMPWKPAGLANLSNWCWVQIEICWEGITLPVYHAMGSWPLGRTTCMREACGKRTAPEKGPRWPVGSKFPSGMWEPLGTSILTTVHLWSGRYNKWYLLLVMTPSCSVCGWFLKHEGTCPSTLEAVVKMCRSKKYMLKKNVQRKT